MPPSSIMALGKVEECPCARARRGPIFWLQNVASTLDVPVRQLGRDHATHAPVSARMRECVNQQTWDFILSSREVDERGSATSRWCCRESIYSTSR